jgi:hypothetical protein
MIKEDRKKEMCMNKILIIGMAIVVVIALVIGAAGLFVAMQNRSAAAVPQGFGMMPFAGAFQSNQSGPGGRGMMGGQAIQPRDDNNRVDMQSYMVKALAKEIGVTESDLTAELNKGTSVLELPAVQTLTVKDLNAKLVAARTAAIDQALADNAITQAQADAMKNTQNGWMMGGFGFGFRK